MQSIPRIAVIGAGIAGLSCASVLREAGLDVNVFDKSRGAAGRMSTRCANDWECDHGAPFFTASHDEFRAEVMRWQEAGVAGLWSPRLRTLGDHALHAAKGEVQFFVGVPRMTSPGRWLAKALDLTPLTTVKQLQRRADGWRLLSAEHGILDHRFDAVLLAMPAPQAQSLLQPVASELAALAGRAVMCSCWALMLRFPASAGMDFDAAHINEGPLRWIARNGSKPGRSGAETWVLHANAAWSAAHLAQDPNSVAQSLIEAFIELGGSAPEAWTTHRWLYADTDQSLAEGSAWHADDRLGLCGDWLNGGKVEGAWVSGRLLAQQVLHSFREPRPAGSDCACVT